MSGRFEVNGNLKRRLKLIFEVNYLKKKIVFNCPNIGKIRVYLQ